VKDAFICNTFKKKNALFDGRGLVNLTCKITTYIEKNK
jgi:hypothetical protein